MENDSIIDSTKDELSFVGNTKEVMTPSHPFNRLRKIDLSRKIKKKLGLNYLSWASAVDVLLQEDPDANWEYKEHIVFPDGTMMVFCTVTAFNKSMTAHLPVMDYKNRSVTNPSSMQINTAMQRCLAKAVALHGVGLYIYSDEDLPKADPDVKTESPIKKAITAGYEKKEITDDVVSAMKRFVSNGKKEQVIKKFDDYVMTESLKKQILSFEKT